MISGGSSRRMFPVGLYAGLLLALIALRRPDLVARAEGWCSTVLVLPLRALDVVAPAGSGVELGRGGSEARVAELQRRVESWALRRPAAVDPALEPVPARVVRRLEPPSGGEPSVLVLDRAATEVRAYERFATRGDALLGFLDDAPPRAGEPARLRLLHDRPRSGLPRRVAAECETGEGQLGFLVEPAATIDRWPLRCTLLDDPYLAASLGGSGPLVRTARHVEDPLGAVPPGLRIGWLRIFGYPTGDRFLPIGLYVEPVAAAETVATVVLWRRRPASEPPPPLGRGWPASLRRLPAPPPAGERWFLTTAEPWLAPRRGAAVVDGSRLVGIVAVGGPGFGLVRPFGEPGQRWSLRWLPDDPGRPVVDLVAVATRRRVIDDSSAVAMRVVAIDRSIGGSDAAGGRRRGQAFTGVGGRDTPPGLWVGDAWLAGEDLVIDAGAAPGGSGIEVWHGAGAAR